MFIKTFFKICIRKFYVLFAKGLGIFSTKYYSDHVATKLVTTNSRYTLSCEQTNSEDQQGLRVHLFQILQQLLLFIQQPLPPPPAIITILLFFFFFIYYQENIWQFPKL